MLVSVPFPVFLLIAAAATIVTAAPAHHSKKESATSSSASEASIQTAPNVPYESVIPSDVPSALLEPTASVTDLPTAQIADVSPAPTGGPFESIGVTPDASTLSIPASPADLAPFVQSALSLSQKLQGVSSGDTGSTANASITTIPVATDGGANILSGPRTINVTIGDGATRFTPAIIKANPGDTLLFSWLGKNNHSVTESDALGSCTKSTSATSFDSGVQQPGTVWSLTLPPDARGLKFFYCKVMMHCVMGGMSATIITPQ